MNKVYKIIWNKILNRWVVCSELAKKAKTKRARLVGITGMVPVVVIIGTSELLISSSVLAATCVAEANGSVQSTTSKNQAGCELSNVPANINLSKWGFVVRLVGSGTANPAPRTIKVLNDLNTNVTGSFALLSIIGNGSATNYSPSYFDAKAKTIDITSTSIPDNEVQLGLEVSWASKAEIGTLNLSMNNLLKGDEHYGIVAGSSNNIGELAATNGTYSYAIIDNANIHMHGSENYRLVNGIRAIQGAGNTNESRGNGSSGYVKINDKLNIDIEHDSVSSGHGVGIYISGGDSQVHLKDSHIKIAAKNSRANGILIGKTSGLGAGTGSLYSTGEMLLDTTASPNSYGAISILHQGALIDANAETSRTTIKTATNGLRIAGASRPVATPTTVTKTLFNNLVIETSKDTGDLVNVTTYQPDYELSVRGTESNLTAPKDGYILNVAGSTEANHSGVTFKFNDGYMQGLVNKSDVSSIDMQLNKSRWQLAESNARNEAKFNELSLTNAELFAFDPNHRNANQASNFILSGNVNSKTSRIDLKNGIKGDLLTINGNYHGTDGIVLVDTEVNDDNSKTDKFIIKGNATGKTELQVNNVGGGGAQTNKGIQVIQTGSSDSNSTFYLKNDYITVGAFDYSLNVKKAEQGSDGSTEDNWYLESKVLKPITPTQPEVPGKPITPTLPEVPGKPITPTLPEVPGEPVTPTLPEVPGEPVTPTLPEVPGEPVTPTLPEVPGEPVTPTLPEVPGEPVTPTLPPVDPTPDPGGDPDPEKPSLYAPVVGSYISLAMMGNTLFNTRLEDREGASRFQNAEKDNGSAWIRAYGGQHEFRSFNDQLKTKGDSFVTQLGIGILSTGEEDQYNLGVMGGYAEYNGKTHSILSDRSSKASLDGYSFGLYGTWFSHPVEKQGGYVDTWILWNHFDNQVSTPESHYNYDSSGITASIEVGGDYLLNQGENQSWWIQPQGQLIYQDVQADHFKDAQGIGIYSGSDNLQARLGFKTYLEIPSAPNAMTSYRPYLALNYIHNTSPYSVAINEVRYENEGTKHLGEVKLGLEGHITQNHQLWINGSYVAGGDDYQTYQGNIGWKFKF